MNSEIIPADSEQPNVLHALVRKRAELAGRIEHNQLGLRHLIADLDHIDCVIRIFDPSIDVTRVRSKPVPPRHAAFKGEVTKLVFDMLREASAPVTSREIAKALLLGRGLDPDDHELGVLMVKRVCACLRVQRQKGFIKLAGTENGLQAWEIAR